MASGIFEYEPSPQHEHEQISLCSSVREILGLIYGFHKNKEKEATASNSVEKLELSVHVKKKSQEGKDELEVFTVKVKCNLAVPIISSLKENKTSNLIKFVQHMQKKEEESHLAVRTPDSDDQNLTRTFVLWMSTKEDNTTVVQIQEETLSKKTALENYNLVLQLRIFMKASVLINEVQSMSRLLCCFKILNPFVVVCLSLEGIQGVDLDLGNIEHLPCNSLQVSSLSKLYNHRALLEDVLPECDTSPLKTFYACVDDTFPKVFCSLIFLPRFTSNISESEKRSNENSGEIFTQVYDSNYVPVDMLEFCLHFQITPEVLLPSDEFKSSMRIIGTSYQDSPSHHIDVCGVLSSMKLVAKDTFQQLFLLRNQKEPDVQALTRTKSAYCSNRQTDHEDRIKKWISDITTTLSDIYIKSTDLSFRANVAQIVPVHTCMSMKSYLQEKLEAILLTDRESNRAQSSAGNTGQCKTTDDELKKIPLSQFSDKDVDSERCMTPDSLDMTDDEWNEIITNHKDIDCGNGHGDDDLNLSHQNESLIHNEISPTSFREELNSSFNGNISHDENICMSVTHSRKKYHSQQHFNTNQTSFQGLTNSNSVVHQDISDREDAFSYKTESNLWKTVGHLNHNNGDCEEITDYNKRPCDENGEHSEKKDAYDQDFYKYSKHWNEMLSSKRPSQNDNMIPNLKKAKVESDIRSDGECLHLNGTMDYFDSSNQDLIELNDRNLGDEHEWKDAVGGCHAGTTCNFANIMQNCFEEAVPDFIPNEQTCDDWFDKDEFEEWCAELQE